MSRLSRCNICVPFECDVCEHDLSWLDDSDELSYRTGWGLSDEHDVTHQSKDKFQCTGPLGKANAEKWEAESRVEEELKRQVVT